MSADRIKPNESPRYVGFSSGAHFCIQARCLITVQHNSEFKLNVQDGYSLLKAWRTWMGWSQSELASKAGVTQVQVARFEAGKGLPRADTLLKLSNALGVMAETVDSSESPVTSCSTR